jgi:hypothetical protein
MQTVDVIPTDDFAYPCCPVCGHLSTDASADGPRVSPCDHLYYVGTSETDEAEYDRDKVVEDVVDDDEDPPVLERLAAQLGDNYVCFLFTEAAPSFMEAYFIYELYRE